MDSSTNSTEQSTFFDVFSKIISFVLFPLFMPLYGISLLFSLPLFAYYPKQYVFSCILIVLLFDIMIPMTIYFLLEYFGIISDIHMYKREDRSIPMALTALTYLCSAFLLCRFAMPLFVVNIMVAISIATLIDAIVSHWWQISAHMTGIGALISAIFMVSLATHINSSWLIAIAFLLAGLLASARLILNRHTVIQLCMGFANGIFSIIIFSMLDSGLLIRKIIIYWA